MIFTTCRQIPSLIWTLMVLCFTFFGEKILGIFAGHYEFAWDSPQQLNDQRYMVYTADDCKEKRNKTDKTHNRFVRRCPGNRPALGVGGGLRERGVRLTALPRV